MLETLPPAPMPELSPLARALAVFGHDGLREGQAEVITDVLDGRPVVAVMPTGAGKSLCYQLPAIMLADKGGVTLVISPLIALMKDQVDVLRARGVAAVALTSAASAEEQRDIIDGLRAGLHAMIYVAPERFRSPRFVDALRALGSRLALVAIDEAHCISEWGHDFRPDYRRLGEMVRDLAPARVAAFTATATPEVVIDIGEQLGMQAPCIHVRGFDRPNLTFTVTKVAGAAHKLDEMIERVRTRDGGVALIYAATRKNAEKYAAELKRVGMRVRVYHAGLGDDVREKAQDRFMDGSLDAVVATNAFGMGIDKSDIRVVVHADIPRSPEAYYQEAGRGGRDGRPTQCHVLFGHGDIRLQEFLIDASYPSAALLRALWKLLREGGDAGEVCRIDNAEDRLRAHLPGDPTAATVGSALRILERHGMLRLQREDGVYVAQRPEPGLYPTLDVELLERRAEVERRKLRTMVEFAYWPRCRRQFLLNYFGDGEWAAADRQCGGCDNCLMLVHGMVSRLSDDDAIKIKKLLLLIGALGGRFGKMRVAGLALGDDEDDRFAEVPERGALRGMSQRAVLDLLRSLEGAGLVEVARGEYPTISTSRRGDQVAIGTLELEGFAIAMPQAGRKRAGGATGGAPRKRPRKFGGTPGAPKVSSKAVR